MHKQLLGVRVLAPVRLDDDWARTQRESLTAQLEHKRQQLARRITDLCGRELASVQLEITSAAFAASRRVQWKQER